MAFLERPRAFENRLVDCDRSPGQKGLHVALGALAVETRAELLGNGHIEFLENLVAEPPASSVAQRWLIHALARRCFSTSDVSRL